MRYDRRMLQLTDITQQHLSQTVNGQDPLKNLLFFKKTTKNAIERQ